MKTYQKRKNPSVEWEIIRKRTSYKGALKENSTQNYK